MSRRGVGRLLLGAALMWGGAAGVRGAGEASPVIGGTLDEHPAIAYASRPTTDRVARLDQALGQRGATLERDARTGYLSAVLRALDIPVESQLLVFSKTGLQREHTSPKNPRALYFNEAVVVGYIPGASSLELAAHDPQQGVVFYTLDQTASGSRRFTRRTSCLTCHLSTSTLEVPGMIVRSHVVGDDGRVIPGLGSHAVDHRTPHTDRWGGWLVTGKAQTLYAPLGNLGNITVTPDPTLGSAIHSNHVLIEWLNRSPDTDRYPTSDSDLAALMAFDHQQHAINLLTRLGWTARIALSEGRALDSATDIRDQVFELADYLLFVDEAPLTVAVTPRAGFAEHLAARVPADGRGRSCGQLELRTRLLKYPCSYMIYSEAFDALPSPVKDAVYRRLVDILSGRVAGQRYAHLTSPLREAILEILQETKADLPAGLRAGTARPIGR
ncbi:MAG: hypothetical protein AB1635_21765 [Acidobacteriota bacterium]